MTEQLEFVAGSLFPNRKSEVSQHPRLRERLVRHPAHRLDSTAQVENEVETQRDTRPVDPPGWYRVPQPVVESPFPPRGESFELLQRWEGTVQSVQDDDVLAILVDKTNPSEDEVATLALEDFSPAERDLVVPGAVFYWTIGYRTVAGCRRRESFFSVRRKPTFKGALPLARREANAWFELFAKPESS